MMTIHLSSFFSLSFSFFVPSEFAQLEEKTTNNDDHNGAHNDDHNDDHYDDHNNGHNDHNSDHND